MTVRDPYLGIERSLRASGTRYFVNTRERQLQHKFFILTCNGQESYLSSPSRLMRLFTESRLLECNINADNESTTLPMSYDISHQSHCESFPCPHTSQKFFEHYLGHWTELYLVLLDTTCVNRPSSRCSAASAKCNKFRRYFAFGRTHCATTESPPRHEIITRQHDYARFKQTLLTAGLAIPDVLLASPVSGDRQQRI